ncbi:MAG: hypothetical protein ACRERE_42135 [Candidatus Entotheonellia bacterium]
MNFFKRSSSKNLDSSSNTPLSNMLAAMDSETLKKFHSHVHEVSTIIFDYDRTLEELVKDGERKIQPILLYPESKLPSSRRVIEDALSTAWISIEHWKMNDYFGISKDALEGISLSLHIHFSPDEEIPENPFDNMLIWAKRVQQKYPDDVAKVNDSFRKNPDFYRSTITGLIDISISKYAESRKSDPTTYLAFTYVMAAWYLSQRENQNR